MFAILYNKEMCNKVGYITDLKWTFGITIHYKIKKQYSRICEHCSSVKELDNIQTMDEVTELSFTEDVIQIFKKYTIKLGPS